MNKLLKSILCFGMFVSSIGDNSLLAAEKNVKQLNNINKNRIFNIDHFTVSMADDNDLDDIIGTFNECFSESLYVNPKYQRQKDGSHFLRQLLNILSSKYPNKTIRVPNSSDSGLNFYKNIMTVDPNNSFTFYYNPNKNS